MLVEFKPKQRISCKSTKSADYRKRHQDYITFMSELQADAVRTE